MQKRSGDTVFGTCMIVGARWRAEDSRDNIDYGQYVHVLRHKKGNMYEGGTKQGDGDGEYARLAGSGKRWRAGQDDGEHTIYDAWTSYYFLPPFLAFLTLEDDTVPLRRFLWGRSVV